MKNNTAVKITATRFADNKKKILIVGGVALVILAGAGYGYYRFRKRKQGSEWMPSITATPRTKPSGGFKCISTSYPLNFGTCHPDVGVLQRYLKMSYKAHLGSYGKNNDGVDAKFGKITKQEAIRHLGKDTFTPQDVDGMKTALKLIKP